MRRRLIALVLASTLVTALGARAQSATGSLIPVTPDNFNRAEADLVFGSIVKDGGLRTFVHHREPIGPGLPEVHPNRDTLYSFGVFDLDAGPVTITLPDAGKRFMSMQVTVRRLTVKDVPVDGFWSISVYDAEGHFKKNDFDAYSLNNVTAKMGADGSVTVQFGGCDGKVPNCLPIAPGWNYITRLCRPRAEILNGTWKFPEAQP